jgi:hypothetical protein
MQSYGVKQGQGWIKEKRKYKRRTRARGEGGGNEGNKRRVEERGRQLH